MPICRVIRLEGQPTQAPWSRIWTWPSGVISTSSTSPPSDWTAGRMRLMTCETRSCNVGCLGSAVGVFGILGEW